MTSIRKLLSLALTVFLIVSPEPCLACMWDTNTIRDEMELEDTPLFHLITGQFPEHSQAFYRRQVARSLATLDKKPEDLQAQDDLGVAYTKLGQFKEALTVFEKLKSLKTDRYETLSNLGVLYKKMGRFSESYETMKRALEIKPAGHMGLGDWYLRAIHFRMEGKLEETGINANFLGYDYGQHDWVWELEDEQESVFLSKLKALIRNDRHFPDTYIVLGDLLNHRMGKKNLALWCYVRSIELEHPRTAMVQDRIRGIHRHWSDAIKNTYTAGKYVEGFDAMVLGLRSDLRERELWLGRFKDVEAELMEFEQDPSFSLVARHLLREKKVVIAPPKAYGIRESFTLSKDTAKLRHLAFLVLALLSLVFAIKAQQSWNGKTR